MGGISMRNAREFRDTAWGILRGRYWWVVLVTLVGGLLGGYYAIHVGISLHLEGTDILYFRDMGQSVKYFLNSANLLRAFFGMAWMFAASVFTFGLALFVLGSAVELGLDLFNIALYAAPGQPKFELLFSRFSQFGRALLLRFLMWLKIFAWSLLFVVPGIVAAYRYALAPYLLAENPELSAEEAIEKSKLLMSGHKGRLFRLQLSFIGWYLLAALTGGAGWVFLAPYTKAADAAFYLERVGRLAPDGAINAEPSPASPAAPARISPPANGGLDGDHPEWI